MDFFSNVFSQFKGKEKKEWNAEEEIIPMRYFSPIDPLVLQMSGRGERRSRLTLQTVLGGSQPAKPSAVFCLSVPSISPALGCQVRGCSTFFVMSCAELH